MFSKKIILVIVLTIVLIVVVILYGAGTNWKFKSSDAKPASCAAKCDGVLCGGEDGCGGQCGCVGTAVCCGGKCGAKCDGVSCGATNGCGVKCGCTGTSACVDGKCSVPVKPTGLSLSGADFKAGVTSAANVFNAVGIHESLAMGKFDGVLMHYASVEFDPSQWPDSQPSHTPTLKGILEWFWVTLNACQKDDCLIIHGDFLSFDGSVLQTICDKVNAGMKFIILVDRWEISGAPLFDSLGGKPWSPDVIGGVGCPACDGEGCDDNKGNQFDRNPYVCCGSVAGNNKGSYCRDTNSALQRLSQGIKAENKANYFLLDMATTKLTWGLSSRQTPLHNHRHMTSFYMKSKNVASVFKGSWNFTGGNPNTWGDGQLPGQKESGIIVTAALDNAAIQSDIITNYYWLAIWSLYVPSSSVRAPETFTAPSSALFQYFLDNLVARKYIDAKNDRLTYDGYRNSSYEVYSVATHNGKTYLAGDARCNISMAVSPPALDAGAIGPDMLKRSLNDGGVVSTFEDILPSLNNIGNVNQFMYPFAPTYKNNPVPPVKWRIDCDNCNCTAAENNDLGKACLAKDSGSVDALVPTNGCYQQDGKNYQCAAKMPWAPGAIWLGGVLFDFWKSATSVYLNMYSSVVDAGTGCILNCNQGNNGGVSTWSGLTTSAQYNDATFNSKVINSGGWYTRADSNSIQNVLDFLKKKDNALYIVIGQWSNLDPGVGQGGALSMFSDAATAAGSSINYRLFSAQKKQVTLKGDNNTVRTRMDSKGENPDPGNNWQRNHTKCYLSKDSLLSCSGHPYNGGVNDWAGVNEALFVEKCPNFVSILRANFEVEYTYSNTIKNSSTFKWAQAWGSSDVPALADPIGQTDLTEKNWLANSTSGGIIIL